MKKLESRNQRIVQSCAALECALILGMLLCMHSGGPMWVFVSILAGMVVVSIVMAAHFK